MLPFQVGGPVELKRFWAREVYVGTRGRNGLGCVWVETTVVVADGGRVRGCEYAWMWSGWDELIDKEERARER